MGAAAAADSHVRAFCGRLLDRGRTRTLPCRSCGPVGAVVMLAGMVVAVLVAVVFVAVLLLEGAVTGGAGGGGGGDDGADGG